MRTTSLFRNIAALLPAALTAAAGCAGSNDDPGQVVARERKITPRPVIAKRMRPLVPAPGAPPGGVPQTGSELELAPPLAVDARALIITADGTDAALDAIE